MDLVERLRKCANGFPLFKTIRGDFGICDEADDEIERLRKVLQEIADKDGWCSAKAVAKRLREAGYVDINTIYKMAEEAAAEIERLREVNVMQARWLHEAQQKHEQYMDYVRKLLSKDVESAVLKEEE